MSRLPTPGGDPNSWGTVLNDYLTKSAEAATLSGATSVGTTTFDLAVVPATLRAGSIIAVDAFTSQCELHQVNSVVGSTVTVASGTRLMFAHAAGDLVVVLPDRRVPAEMYALNTGTTDQWQQLQRLVLEACYWDTVVSMTPEVYVAQPILVDTDSRWERVRMRSHSSFAPVEEDGAMILVGNGSFFFNAVASTNVFTSTASDYTTTVSHGLSNDITIVFNDPYAAGLPGGVTAGQIYYVKSTPTASTFTISATLGGSTLDVSSDGRGWSMNNPGDGLARVHWETTFITLTVADLNGMKMALAQPSWTRNTRIDMAVAASVEGGATGWILTGQQSYHDNVEANTWDNCIAMSITGTGHIVKGFNSVGNGTAGDTALVLAGDSLGIYGLWTESHDRASVEVADTCRGLLIEGPWIIAHQTGGIPCLLVTGSQTSYEVGIMRHTAGTGLFVQDTSARDFEIDLATDVFNGLMQPFGNIYPTLKQRSAATSITTTPYTLTSAVEYLSMQTSGGNKTVNLPPVTGTAGLTFTIDNAPDSGTNTITVTANGAELIDLSNTKVLDPYEAITILSNGLRWLIVSERP